jgi:hypothetical protein
MPRITFTDTRVVRDHLAGTPAETKFHAGLTYALPADSCARWKLRGAAIDAPELPAIAAIRFRQDLAGHVRKVYAEQPWPPAVGVAGELLRNPLPGMTVAATAVRFAVENGHALYTRISHEAAADMWYGQLVDQEWSQPPAAPSGRPALPRAIEPPAGESDDRQAPAFRIVAAKFGRKNVVDAAGNPVNPKPLTQDEATALLAGLLADKAPGAA